MPTLTITNNTSEPVLVQELYATVAANGTISTERTRSEIEGMSSFLASVAAGDLSYTLTPSDDEVAAGVHLTGSETVSNLGAPAAASATSVHASYNGDEADNNFPGPITNPDVPRVVSATFAGTWDGGDITVTGTDQFGAAISEVLTSNPGGATTGTKAFATVTAIAKELVGSNAVGASVGTGTVLGIPVKINSEATNVLYADGVNEAGTYDTSNHTVDPTTAPDGSTNFLVLVA
jgi:hypothetical protein